LREFIPLTAQKDRAGSPWKGNLGDGLFKPFPPPWLNSQSIIWIRVRVKTWKWLQVAAWSIIA